jgi:hypothetical protein
MTWAQMNTFGIVGVAVVFKRLAHIYLQLAVDAIPTIIAETLVGIDHINTGSCNPSRRLVAWVRNTLVVIYCAILLPDRA